MTDTITIATLIMNWILWVVIVFIIYRFLKKTVKRWITEAMDEYNKKTIMREAMRDVEHRRAKFK